MAKHIALLGVRGEERGTGDCSDLCRSEYRSFRTDGDRLAHRSQGIDLSTKESQHCANSSSSYSLPHSPDLPEEYIYT